MASQVDRNTVRVAGFKIGEEEFQVGQGSTMTIADLETKYGLRGQKVVWILNGSPITASAASSTVLSPGDRVEVARANRGGF